MNNQFSPPSVSKPVQQQLQQPNVSPPLFVPTPTVHKVQQQSEPQPQIIIMNPPSNINIGSANSVFLQQQAKPNEMVNVNTTTTTATTTIVTPTANITSPPIINQPLNIAVPTIQLTQVAQPPQQPQQKQLQSPKDLNNLLVVNNSAMVQQQLVNSSSSSLLATTTPAAIPATNGMLIAEFLNQTSTKTSSSSSSSNDLLNMEASWQEVFHKKSPQDGESEKKTELVFPFFWLRVLLT